MARRDVAAGASQLAAPSKRPAEARTRSAHEMCLNRHMKNRWRRPAHKVIWELVSAVPAQNSASRRGKQGQIGAGRGVCGWIPAVKCSCGGVGTVSSAADTGQHCLTAMLSDGLGGCHPRRGGGTHMPSSAAPTRLNAPHAGGLMCPARQQGWRLQQRTAPPPNRPRPG